MTTPSESEIIALHIAAVTAFGHWTSDRHIRIADDAHRAWEEKESAFRRAVAEAFAIDEGEPFKLNSSTLKTIASMLVRLSARDANGTGSPLLPSWGH